MTAILAVTSITLLASFICSLFEAAFYTITPTKVELLRKNKSFGADKLARLRRNIEEPIAAILTVNTVANAFGSAWLGALAAKQSGEHLVGVCAAVLSFSILIVGEIIPKNIGVSNALWLAPRIAWPIQILIWISWPIVRVCSFVVRFMTRSRQQPGPTEDEIMIMSRLAYQRGELRSQELRWVENALRLDQVRVRDLMTPRTVVYSLPADLKLSDVQKHSEHWVHSRLPLTEDRDPHSIPGMVYRREVFDALLRGNLELTLRNLMHAIDFVPDSMRGHQLLDKFITEKKHMVAVLDEYGSFQGVVTLEDVLECLLGSEIVDEYDRHVDMQQFALEQARKRGSFGNIESVVVDDARMK